MFALVLHIRLLHIVYDYSLISFSYVCVCLVFHFVPDNFIQLMQLSFRHAIMQFSFHWALSFHCLSVDQSYHSMYGFFIPLYRCGLCCPQVFVFVFACVWLTLDVVSLFTQHNDLQANVIYVCICKHVLYEWLLSLSLSRLHLFRSISVTIPLAMFVWPFCHWPNNNTNKKNHVRLRFSL